MAMVSCGSSRKCTPCLGSRGGDADGSSVCALTLYIPWLRCSSKALQPFLGIVFGWVVGAKSWQLWTENRGPATFFGSMGWSESMGSGLVMVSANLRGQVSNHQFQHRATGA